MSELPTGVTVVTTRRPDGSPAGTTVSAVTSLSLDPPLVLVCLARSSNTLAAVRATGTLAVNVLGTGSEAVSDAFARSGNDAAWELTNTVDGLGGSPLLTDAHVALECHVEEITAGGDHEIVIARVVDTVHPDEPSEPLVHHRGAYGRLAEGPEFTTPDHSGVLDDDRRRREAQLRAVEARLPSTDGALRMLAHEDDDGLITTAVLHGDPARSDTPLLAIHHACVLGDALGSTACSCAADLARAQAALADAPDGVLIYVKHDHWLSCDQGRSADLATVTGLLRRAGVRAVRPLESSPELASALRAAGIGELSGCLT